MQLEHSRVRRQKRPAQAAGHDAAASSVPRVARTDQTVANDHQDLGSRDMEVLAGWDTCNTAKAITLTSCERARGIQTLADESRPEEPEATGQDPSVCWNDCPQSRH
jgi:hypothetical protein